MKRVKFGSGMFGIVMVLLAADPAAAYRPFVSTDAAVADPREVEVEFGAFTLQRTGDRDTFATPSAVVNYGILERWELVAEVAVQEGSRTEVTEPALLLKSVLKEGVFQDKDGVSLAVEAGLLLPSTVKGEHGVGFEATGILSGRLAPVTFRISSSTRRSGGGSAAELRIGSSRRA